MKLSSLVKLSLALSFHHAAISVELRGVHAGKSERNLLWELPLRDGHDYTTGRENDEIIRVGPILDQQLGQPSNSNNEGRDEDFGDSEDFPFDKNGDDDRARFLDTVLFGVLELLCEQNPDSIYCSDALEALVEAFLDLYCQRNPDDTICLDVCASFPNVPGCNDNGFGRQVNGSAQGVLDAALDKMIELLCDQIPENSIFCSDDKDGIKVLLESSLIERLMELYCERNPDSPVCFDVCESFPDIPVCEDDGNGGRFRDGDENNDAEEDEGRPIFNFQNNFPNVLGYDGVDEDKKDNGQHGYQDDVGGEDEPRPVFNFDENNLPNVLGYDGVDGETEDDGHQGILDDNGNAGGENEADPSFFLPGDGSYFSGNDSANENERDDTEAVCSCLCTSQFAPEGGVLVEQQVDRWGRTITQTLCVDQDTATTLIQFPGSDFSCAAGDACLSD